ncbi:MAG TPA: hypothetical protein VD866_01930 [Urbifossiella sp.]|nr:hypothetical protein [Urbifossiella sp.]
MIPAILALKRFWPLALALATFGAGWTVNGWRWEARHADELQQEIDIRAAQERVAYQASAALEVKLAAERKKATQIARKLDHELQKVVYRCPIPVDGVRILNEAVFGTAPGERGGTATGD